MRLFNIFENLLLEATKEQLYKKYYSHIPYELFDTFASTDPEYESNPNRLGGYAKWLLKLILPPDTSEDRLDMIDSRFTFEMRDEYRKIFTDFEKLKKMGRLKEDDISADLNQYKTLREIEDIVDKYRNSEGEILSKSEQIKRAKEASEVFYEDDKTFVVIPETQEASCYYGKSTRWCTAAEERNAFKDYNERGDLYIIIDKVNDRKYQLFLPDDDIEDMEFRDDVENQLPLSDLDLINEKMADKIHNKIVSEYGEAGITITDLDEWSEYEGLGDIFDLLRSGGMWDYILDWESGYDDAVDILNGFDFTDKTYKLLRDKIKERHPDHPDFDNDDIAEVIEELDDDELDVTIVGALRDVAHDSYYENLTDSVIRQMSDGFDEVFGYDVSEQQIKDLLWRDKPIKIESRWSFQPNLDNKIEISQPYHGYNWDYDADYFEDRLEERLGEI